MWTGVISGQRISKNDIDAELLCFGPSGFAGYNLMGTGNLLAGTSPMRSGSGVGDNLSNYASFNYQADDNLPPMSAFEKLFGRALVRGG